MNIETAEKISNLVKLKERLLNIAKHYNTDSSCSPKWFSYLSNYLDLHVKTWNYGGKEYKRIAKDINSKTYEFLKKEISIKIEEIDNQIKQIQC